MRKTEKNALQRSRDWELFDRQDYCISIFEFIDAYRCLERTLNWYLTNEAIRWMLNLKLFSRYIFNTLIILSIFYIKYVHTLESWRRCWSPGRCRSGNQTQTSKKAANSHNCWAVFAAHKLSRWLHFARTMEDWLPTAGLTLHRCPFVWVGVAFSFPFDSTDDAWILK